VINSGTRTVVFVALSEGKVQPREIKIGETDGQHVEVVEGLSDGELVVTRANFLIDSESRLRASLSAMGPSVLPVAVPAATKDTQAPAPGGHRHTP
jgi:Cu(I)/Ag(I) efflux system membrane fusion protein